MRRRLIGLASMCAALLVACGVPGRQAADATMSTGVCSVDPVDLHSGAADFVVRNENTRTLKFLVSENDNSAVANATVEPGAVVTVTVTLDEDDLYHTRCGDVVGPDLVVR